MAITLKRQLTDSEKKEIIERHGRVCFATGHEIAKDQTLQFDHIRAFDTQGPSELHNIAPMCETHNKAKGRLPLEDFRVRLRQDEEERARPFYRDLSSDDLERIKKMVERLVNWKLWSAPPNGEIDRKMADNKSEVKDWFRANGLTTGYLMGANE